MQIKCIKYINDGLSQIHTVHTFISLCSSFPQIRCSQSNFKQNIFYLPIFVNLPLHLGSYQLLLSCLPSNHRSFLSKIHLDLKHSLAPNSLFFHYCLSQAFKMCVRVFLLSYKETCQWKQQ